METDGLFLALYSLEDFPPSLGADTARGRAFRKRVDKQVLIESFSSDQVLLEKGKLQKTMYFLDQGFARGFCHDEDTGAEVTLYLWDELSFVVSPYSFYHQKPSHIAIEVCAGSKVISATFQDMQAVFAEFPEGEIMTRAVPIHYLEMQEWRSGMTERMSPEARYKTLLKRFPGVGRHFKTEVIASYVNLARETVSRLRKFHD